MTDEEKVAQVKAEKLALGKLAFERYTEAMEGITSNGFGFPPWGALEDRVRTAWMVAADAVRLQGWLAGYRAAEDQKVVSDEH